MLKRLGEIGLREAKPVFMSAILDLLASPQARVFWDHPTHLTALLCYIKRMFVYQGSVERQDDGQSPELRFLIEIALL